MGRPGVKEVERVGGELRVEADAGEGNWNW